VGIDFHITECKHRFSEGKAVTALLLVNGKQVDFVRADDTALLQGVGVFETLRTYGATPFRLGAHLERLQYSARILGVSLDLVEVAEEIQMHLGENVSIRYTLTGSGTRILQRRPIDPGYVGRARTVAPIDWIHPVGLPGDIKHTSRLPWLASAQALGVDEVLLCDPDGRILEANRSNVFAVVGGRLQTPPLDGNQLEGVTRGALLDAARQAGIEVSEEEVPSWADFDAFYLSSTLKELAPVSAIGEERISTEHPLGTALYAAFRSLVAEECP
jgi:branched-subunit amino acid aminotransferase/4-amino-4-deoxychorismate lyase